MILNVLYILEFENLQLGRSYKVQRTTKKVYFFKDILSIYHLFLFFLNNCLIFGKYVYTLYYLSYSTRLGKDPFFNANKQ